MTACEPQNYHHCLHYSAASTPLWMLVLLFLFLLLRLHLLRPVLLLQRLLLRRVPGRECWADRPEEDPDWVAYTHV